MCILGNLELSKDVLHKQINFIVTDKELGCDKSLYGGKSYAISFLKTLLKKGLDYKRGIRELEDRFLPEEEKQLLIIVLDSITSKDVAATKI